MKARKLQAITALVLVFSQPTTQAMGLRSFVALPVEKGGTVVRAALEHNSDTDTTTALVSAAYGINHRQTLLFGMPYRLSSGDGNRSGDVSVLWRQIVLQVDSASGTDRLGLLGGVVIPTASDRDAAVQAGAVFTRFHGRNEFDLDVLYQQGLGTRDHNARYDLSWQYRISPADYPEWGIATEWYVVTEVGGRWREAHSTVHQFTLGLQRVAKRWVIEGGVTQDLNNPQHTRFLIGIRFH